MSSTINKLYTNKYSSFGQAVFKYLEYRGLEQSWLVEKIIEKDQKFRSLQQMMSRWLGGATISRHYRNKINAVLDVNVYKDQEGFWRISRTENESPDIPGAKTTFSIDQLLKEERSRLGIEDIPDTERGRELQGMLDDAVSLVLKLLRSIEKEKLRSDK